MRFPTAPAAIFDRLRGLQFGTDERQQTSDGGDFRTLRSNPGDPVRLRRGSFELANGINRVTVETTNPADDELPEDEPLTPELVEEEAIRGDFMLRWAAIFLALLFGFSKISDTRTLVHIKSGDQMRANGFLPSGTDTFSFTADGQPYANVSWLFDHVIGFVWSVGQETGLTLFKAILAVVIAGTLVNISVAGVPTWWSSICAVFAIVACSGDFAAQTELMTLLGMVWVLKYLHQHREGKDQGLTWKLPVLMAVWCNLDSRAWIGAFTILMYAIGTQIGNRQRRGDEPPKQSDAPVRGNLWLPAGLCFAALLLNPFPLNSLLSPTTMYSVEYPAMQEQRPVDSSLAAVSFDGRVDYFPMWMPDTFLLFDHTQISGLAILLIAFVVLLLARNRQNTGYLAVLLGLTLLAIWATHELAIASLAAAMIAGTAAQRWYRANYSMQYSLDARELMFSRGGRALTVFALALLGFCVVAGRLPGNTPVGLGFDRETRTTIDTLGPQLATLDPDARILHTRIDQGDILIWHGRKSLIDSRLLPFGRMSDPTSVISRHKLVLLNLLAGRTEAKDAEEEKKQQQEKTDAMNVIQEMQITHAMPRLSPPGSPDYRSIQSLISTDDWLLTSVGPSAALVKKIPPKLPAEERVKLLPQFGDLAFRDVTVVPVSRSEFAGPADFYQKYVYRERPSLNEHLRLAEHYLWLSGGEVQSADQAMASLALTMMAIRSTNRSLYDDSDHAGAYRLLGVAYERLGALEGMLSGQQGPSTRSELRSQQSMMALRQALRINPVDTMAWQLLFQNYSARNHTDLASECLDQLLALIENPRDEIEVEAMIKEMSESSRQLHDSIRTQREQLQTYLKDLPAAKDDVEKGAQMIQIAASLAQAGFSREALKLLKDYTNEIRQNPAGQILLGRLLIDCGELEEGHRTLTQLAAVARDQPEPFADVQWHFPSAVSQLALADYASAIDYWGAQLATIEQVLAAPDLNNGPLATLPFSAEQQLNPASPLPTWPLSHLNSLQLSVAAVANARADVRFLIAMCHVEEGNMKSAQLILQSIISECGDSQNRNIAAGYLAMIDKDAGKYIQENMPDIREEFEFLSTSVSATPATPPATTPTTNPGANPAP